MMPATIWPRMRSIGAWSKRGCSIARRKQLQRLVLLVGEHAHRAVDRVAAAAEAHLGAGVVETVLEGVAVEIAGALVEQPGHQIDQPFLAGRILGVAAAKGEAHRDDRNRIVLDQPGGDAAVRLDLLDGDRGASRQQRRQRQEDDGQQCRGNDRREPDPAKLVHHLGFL